MHKSRNTLPYIPGTELNPNVTYSIKNTQDNMSYTVKKYILFLHAISGCDTTSTLFLHAISRCDTTSALFRQGKKKAVKIIENKGDLHPFVVLFYKINSHPEEIAEAGEKFLLQLYGAPKMIVSLDDLRYKRFQKASKKSLQSEVNMATLPPTSSASKQHSFRVYYQIQQWLLPATYEFTDVINASKWGWERKNGMLSPIGSLKHVAPDELLKMMACGCKKGCGKACSCRKTGLKCSALCEICSGLSCTNSADIMHEPDDETYEKSATDNIVILNNIHEGEMIECENDDSDNEDS